MPRIYTPTGDLADIDARKQKRLLKVLLENGGFIEAAIRDVHTSRRWLNQQLESDEEFAALYTTIIDQANEHIEEEIYRRAVVGTAKPLSYKGELTGDTVTEYSDNLLMFLAKARMPARYRDLQQKGSELTDEELNTRITAYMRKRKESETSVPVN